MILKRETTKAIEWIDRRNGIYNEVWHRKRYLFGILIREQVSTVTHNLNSDNATKAGFADK